MALYTSYLGFFNRKDCFFELDAGIYVDTRSHNPRYMIPFFIMRNRGNNEVAPTAFLLKSLKDAEINWSEYRHRYLDWIGSKSAVEWMKRIGETAQKHDVVLICYEKDAEHCHRTLLAEAISKWSGVEYKGELTEA